MKCAVRHLAAVALVPLTVGCFNSSKTTNVHPNGATSPQPTECLQTGASCHSGDDCCSGSCDSNTCVEKK